MSDDDRVETALRTLDSALGLLDAQSGSIHLREGAVPSLRLLCQRGLPAEFLPVIETIPFGKGMAGVAAERVEPVSTCNLQTTTAPEVRPGARQSQLNGALVVPMLLGDEVVGTIGVGVRGERSFTAAQARQLLDVGAGLARRLLARSPAEALLTLLRPHLDPAQRDWIDTQVTASASGDRAAVELAFPAVGRHLGRGSLNARGALVSDEKGDEVPLRAWRVDDAGRAALVVCFQGDRERLARDLYFQGDLRERVGALRALAIVGRGDAAVDAVLDAARVAAAELLEAALVENPYASRHLPAHDLRRAILKCAQNGISVERVALLAERADAELGRLLLSLVSERENANRAVPPDLWPVMALAPPPGLCAKLLGYLEHPTVDHRLATARALARLADPRARPFVEDRLAREPDETVRRALTWVLA